MKYLILFFFFLSIQSFTQNHINGEIVYRISLDKNSFDKSKNKEVSNTVKNLIKNSQDVFFVLEFNMNESIYKKSKTLKNDVNSSINLTEIMAGNNNLYYHSKDNYSNLMVMPISGENYIISKPKVEWNLTKESKKIGDYVCFKAIMKNSKDEIVAWYTPSIPASHGPNSYNGLPGLILELKNSMIVYYAYKISFNNSTKLNISKPINGINITYEEFKKKFGGVFNE